MLLTIEPSLQSQWALSLYIVFPPKTMLVGGLIFEAYLFTNSQTHRVGRNLTIVDQILKAWVSLQPKSKLVYGFSRQWEAKK